MKSCGGGPKSASVNSLIIDVLSVHPAVEFGKFYRHDNAGNEEHTTSSQTKPECVLKHTNAQENTLAYMSINSSMSININKFLKKT